MRSSHILVEEVKGKRPLERPGYRWEDGIKVGLNRGMVWNAFSCLRMGPSNNRLVSTAVIEGKRPLGSPGH
jgi:hypothetical protein